jgi:L-ascorbate metabolism protein UlaG (beta-lactamase superfamily)
MRKTSALFIAVASLLIHTGQPAAQIDPLRNYWGDLDAFFNRQAEFTLGLAEDALTRFPPRLPESEMRRLALVMLDAVLHDPAAPSRPAVQDFYHTTMDLAAGELERNRVSRGALIWKLYDHGFIVRTPTVTIAFDLVRGYSAGVDGFVPGNAVFERIVSQCDALFISHRHGDHADSWIAETFLDQGKPVVAPAEVWADSTIHGRMTILDREPHRTQSLTVHGGATELQVVVYPGHQGNVPNNVTLVISPEGMSFCHTGDQSSEDDFGWIEEVGANHRVDVLMPNCWTTDIARLVDGFDPGVVIPGHENELGHSVDHREPYWLTYDRMSRSSYPMILMTWGESFHFVPR